MLCSCLNCRCETKLLEELGELPSSIYTGLEGDACWGRVMPEWLYSDADNQYTCCKVCREYLRWWADFHDVVIESEEDS